MLDGVAFQQAEGAGEAGGELGREVGPQGRVLLHRPDPGAGLEERGGQGAQARPHLHHVVAAGDLRQFERLADDVAVDEKVLPEMVPRNVPEAAQQRAGGRWGKGMARRRRFA